MFLAILGIWVINPIINTIMNMWTDAGFYIKTATTIVIWLVYAFITWGYVWIEMFRPKIEQAEINTGGDE